MITRRPLLLLACSNEHDTMNRDNKGRKANFVCLSVCLSGVPLTQATLVLHSDIPVWNCDDPRIEICPLLLG